MAESYPFANQSLSPIEWGRMARIWQTNGVTAGVGDNLEVAISGSDAVIGSGALWIQGFFYYNLSTKTVPLATGVNYICAQVDPSQPTEVSFISRSTVPAPESKNIFVLASINDTTIYDYRRYAGRSILSFIVGNGATVIPTGKMMGVTMPYDALITAWNVIGDSAGALSTQILKTDYTNWSATAGDAIISPTIPSGAAKGASYPNSPSTSPAVAVRYGDILRPNVVSANTIKQATINLFLAPLMAEE